MICGRGMSSDAGRRPEVKVMTGHPPAVCSRVWPRRREKNDNRQLTNGMVERAADASKKNGVGDGWASQWQELADWSMVGQDHAIHDMPYQPLWSRPVLADAASVVLWGCQWLSIQWLYLFLPYFFIIALRQMLFHVAYSRWSADDLKLCFFHHRFCGVHVSLFTSLPYMTKST